MNQRKGKTHSAALGDGSKIDFRQLVNYVHNARIALEKEGFEDAAFRFEMFEEFLRHDYANGHAMEFKTRHLGM